MNNITPTLRHIRKKFFCNKARIFPFDVILKQSEKSPQSSHSIAAGPFVGCVVVVPLNYFKEIYVS